MIKLSKSEKNDYNKFNKLKKYTGDYFYDFGYNSFGKFLFGYSNWIAKKIYEFDIDKVFFLSRDGYIMKKAFDLFNYDGIDTHYLEVSRRSLRIPVLYKNNSFNDVINCLPNAKLISIDVFFETIGLKKNKYRSLFEKYGLLYDMSFDSKEIKNNSSLKKFYEEVLINDVIKNSKEEYENLVKYLKQEKVFGKFAIVDIGWSGSMQRYLCSTLDELNIENSIYGFYIGVADYYINNYKINNSLKMYGYLFDFKNSNDPIDYRKPFVGLFETLFLEQDGSVEKYISINNKIISKRMNYEYKIDNKYTKDFLNVKNIQKGALDFIKGNYLTLNTADISPFVLFYDIYSLGINPSMRDVRRFGEFQFEDNGKISYLAKRNKNVKFKEDFLSSRWKIGFLKRNFLLKLDYAKIFDLLYHFK